MTRDDDFARLAAEYPGAVARFRAAPFGSAVRGAAALDLATLRGSILRVLEAAGREVMAAVVGEHLVTASLSPLDGGGWRLAVEVEDYSPAAPLAGVAVAEGSP